MSEPRREPRDSASSFWMGLALASLAVAVAAVAVAVWALQVRELGPRPDGAPTAEQQAPSEPVLVLEPVSYAELPGWSTDDALAALETFAKGCPSFRRLPAERVLEPSPLGRTAGDWARVCGAIPGERTSAAARAFFEAELEPWVIGDGDDFEGFLTGYYEPLLAGSRSRRPGFDVPLYRRPPELVQVDLGLFRETWKGERTAGVVVDGSLRPYADRDTIDQGALSGRGLELVWVDDPIDAFFLHIQGSGRIALAEGGEMRVGYAGQNGHPYLAIGRELVSRGAMTKEQVTMQSLRRWLDEHPVEAPEILRANASFVFFRELDEDGPLGSLGVALTGGRSLAVDRRFLPLGAPIYLDGTVPGPSEEVADEALQRLVVAQDTGGAIRGPARGDLFWGAGDEAASRAGRMKHPARMWLLAPRSASGTPELETR